jgi:hypothetical protein
MWQVRQFRLNFVNGRFINGPFVNGRFFNGRWWTLVHLLSAIAFSRAIHMHSRRCDRPGGLLQDWMNPAKVREDSPIFWSRQNSPCVARLIALSAATALGVLGAASTAQAGNEGEDTGGFVMPGSMVGVNPVYHPEWFGRRAEAAADRAGNAFTRRCRSTEIVRCTRELTTAARAFSGKASLGLIGEDAGFPSENATMKNDAAASAPVNVKARARPSCVGWKQKAPGAGPGLFARRRSLHRRRHVHQAPPTAAQSAGNVPPHRAGYPRPCACPGARCG